MNTTEATTTLLLREPQQHRSRKLVDDICLATLMVASKIGLRGVTTNHIADAAGVYISSLYRFFPDKVAILRYIYTGWLMGIRKVWDSYETRAEFLRLEWNEYFIALSDSWQVSGTEEYYSSLHGVTWIYPELNEIEVNHRNYYIEFFIRQMERFGANGTTKQWQDLATYLYIVEDELYSEPFNDVFSHQDARSNLFKETMIFHLGKILPTS